MELCARGHKVSRLVSQSGYDVYKVKQVYFVYDVSLAGYDVSNNIPAGILLEMMCACGHIRN